MECDESRFLADIPDEWIVREEIREEDRPPVTGEEARSRLDQLRQQLADQDTESAL